MFMCNFYFHEISSNRHSNILLEIDSLLWEGLKYYLIKIKLT